MRAGVALPLSMLAVAVAIGVTAVAFAVQRLVDVLERNLR